MSEVKKKEQHHEVPAKVMEEIVNIFRKIDEKAKMEE